MRSGLEKIIIFLEGGKPTAKDFRIKQTWHDLFLSKCKKFSRIEKAVADFEL
jgi:hypothetical protein